MSPRLSSTVVAACFMAASGTAYAQAWVGEQFDLSIGFTTGYTNSDTTLEGDLRITGVPVHFLDFGLNAEFVPIDGLAITAGANMTMGAYKGPKCMDDPMLAAACRGGLILDHGDNDDGAFHAAVSDFTASVRYMVLEEPIAITPVIRGRIPLHDYETRGYAATGQGLKQLGFGLNVGRVGLGLDTLFIQANYYFTLVEKYDGGGDETSQFTLHRSEASLVFGWFAWGPLMINVGTNLLFTHGGFDLIDIAMSSPELREFHDPVRMQQYVLVGGGIQYTIADSLTIDLLFRALVWGDNVTNAKVTQLALTWAPLALFD